ncbi:MAG: hypothetical protein ACK4HF_02460 [Paracoccaceae bacterium]
MPCEEAALIPVIMRGTRPDVEFVGRKIVPHEELTAALLDGTLDIDEGDFVFIDHSQTFKPEFVATLDSGPAQRLILRYATVMLMREICAKNSVEKITRAAVTAIEDEILEKLQDRIDTLNFKVDSLRRHPMRRKISPENVATGQRILEWDQRLREKGFCGLVDGWHASGNTQPRLHPAVAAILGQILKQKVTFEDISIRRLHGLVKKGVENKRAEIEQDFRRREQDGEIVAEEEWADLDKIVPPCIRTVKSWKNLISPLVQVFNAKGPDWLLRIQLITGMGLHVERVGQVVIIDEYDADLMSIIPWEFLLHWLGAAKLEQLGISEEMPLRVVLSVMLDAFTGCIVSLQLGLTATPELAKRTIMMSMMDKTKIATACGAEGVWNQFLRPEKIVHDSGNSYLAYATDELCAALRIDKVAAPKAKAFLRGLLERIFRTIHENLFAAIPGKTFTNTVRRGEYDSQAEAVLTLDDLIKVLVVWIVDIYHNSPNLGRDGLTPADLWHHEMNEGMGCRPVPALKTMTHVFGTTVHRTAQATGIRIMHANYSSKQFALELLRNPTRRFRVRWWEENMSEAQVEIRPMVWIPLEVMDPRARGLCVDDWLLVLERRHIARNPDAAETKRRAQNRIDDLVNDRISTRRKVARKTLGTEADILRLEERTLRYFNTPTTAISSEQTHGLYGVPVGDLPADSEEAETGDEAMKNLPAGSDGAPDPDFNTEPAQLRRPSLGGRRKATTWKPGTME